MSNGLKIILLPAKVIEFFKARIKQIIIAIIFPRINDFRMNWLLSFNFCLERININGKRNNEIRISIIPSAVFLSLLKKYDTDISINNNNWNNRMYFDNLSELYIKSLILFFWKRTIKNQNPINKDIIMWWKGNIKAIKEAKIT